MTATETGRVDPAIVALAEAALAQQTAESTGTRTRMITGIRVEAAGLELPFPPNAPFTGC